MNKRSLRPKLKQPPATRQQTPAELLGQCLSFLQRKYYQDKDRQFAQDRQRLLQWVVLWPAKWFNERGVTIHTSQYLQIFTEVFMDGLRFGNTGNITYLPAWLAKVIRSHFDHHGDEIYAAAKSMRTLTDSIVLGALMAGKPAPTPAPDPIRELADAQRLLKPKNHGKRTKPLTPKPNQLTLL